MKLFASALALFCSAVVQAQQPIVAEYFIDSDPGYGLARSIGSLTEGTNSDLTFDLSDAKAGAHVLYVRCQGSDGRWSTTMSRPLYVEQLQDIVYVEYYVDDDPGVGKATPLSLPDVDYRAHLDFDFNVSTDGLELGIHELFVRARDAFDQWTDVMSRKFEVVEGGGTEPVVEPGDLARMEYFFDNDPGYGKGIALTKPNTGENTYEVSFAGVEPGFHLFCLRAQGEDGRWSSVLSRPLYVVNPLGVAAIEYFFDEDPGEGKATAVEVPENLDDAFAFMAATDDLPVGEHTFCVRAKGLDGLWSIVSTGSFTVGEGLTVPGDVNGDGKVDIVDVTSTISNILGQMPEMFNEAAADVNGDGKVDIVDVTSIIDMILKGK